MSLPCPKPVICQLWLLSFSSLSRYVGRFESVLSADEWQRAERFATPILRQRFVLARGGLRFVLATELGVAPDKLQFMQAAQGKPVLLAGSVPKVCEFNLSHSGEWLAILLSSDAPVGVDVEQQKPLGRLLAIAERFFAAGEVLWLKARPESEQLQAFYRLWSLKEAYVKGLGLGISAGLSGFSLLPDEVSGRASLLDRDRDGFERDWSVFSSDLLPEYSLAWAIRAQQRKVEVIIHKKLQIFG